MIRKKKTHGKNTYIQKNLWRRKTHAKRDTQRHNFTTDKCKKSKKKRAKTVYAKETRIKKTHLTKKTYKKRRTKRVCARSAISLLLVYRRTTLARKRKIPIATARDEKREASVPKIANERAARALPAPM